MNPVARYLKKPCRNGNEFPALDRRGGRFGELQKDLRILRRFAGEKRLSNRESLIMLKNINIVYKYVIKWLLEIP